MARLHQQRTHGSPEEHVVPDHHEDRAPAPGDPRDRGPRPRATGRDLAWSALALVLSVVTAVQFTGLALALLRLEEAVPTLGLVAGFVITVVWLLTISWLVLGAWRRSVWGCPFRHTSDAPAPRRCPRHALVPSEGSPAMDT